MLEREGVRTGAIQMTELLNEIEVPAIDVPDLDAFSVSIPGQKDLFAEKKRAGWKQVQTAEARCDFSPNKVRISFRHPSFGIISLWKKSVYGRTLTEIKEDDSMVDFFATNVTKLIQQMLGFALHSGDWCIVTSPKRRHKQRNFATLITAEMADLLHIPFVEDLALCESRHRVDAVFSLGAQPPTQRNIIVFDDFVTTGSTMLAMKNLLQPLGYNLIFFTGINNKL